jgi:hypothetical protein
MISLLLIMATHAQSIGQQHQKENGPSVFHSLNKKYSGKINMLDNHNTLAFRKINNQSSSFVLMQKLDSLIVEEIYEGQLENSFKNIYEYNYLGLVTSFTEFEYGITDQVWTNSYHSTFMYGTDGKVIEEISSQWDFSSNDWLLFNKELSSYSPDGNLSTVTDYYWDPVSLAWILTSKDEFSYSENGKLVLTYNYNEETDIWEINYKTDYQYDENGKELSITSSYVESAVWIYSDKIEFTYSADTRLESFIGSFWVSDAWEFDIKEQFSYNTEGDLIVHTVFEWDDIADHWTSYYKEENEFNNLYDYSELLVPEVFYNNSIYFNHMLTQMSAFEYYASNWNFLGRIMFYYSETDITGIQHNQAAESVIFPNPANDRISFSWYENTPIMQLEIFNAAGILVLNRWVDNHSTISISCLPKGLYLFKLSDKQAVGHAEKFIVQ